MGLPVNEYCCLTSKSHRLPVQYWSNYHFWQGCLSLTNLFSETCSNIAVNHILLKTRFYGLLFLSQTVRVYLNHFDVIVPQSCQIRYNNAKKRLLHRVATHLENLEKSENSKVVRENLGKIEKSQGNWNLLQLSINIPVTRIDYTVKSGPGLWICSSLTLL